MENKSLLYPCASAARRVISLDGMGALCCHYCSTIFVYAILNHQNVAKTFRSLYNMDIIEGKGGLDR